MASIWRNGIYCNWIAFLFKCIPLKRELSNHLYDLNQSLLIVQLIFEAVNVDRKALMKISGSDICARVTHLNGERRRKLKNDALSDLMNLRLQHYGA